MEVVKLNDKTSYSRSEKLINNSSVPSDLPRLIRKMKDAPGWKNGDLAATILLKSPDKQIVLTALHRDTEITSFQSGDSFTFQIIEGKVKFRSRDETIILENGQHLTLYSKIKFSLTTHDEESVFLLTINTGMAAYFEN